MITTEKADVLARLQREILSLQGYKPGLNAITTDTGLGSIRYAFPNAVFPTGAMHEFLCEDKAATTGFIAGILSSLMRNNGVCVWIGPFQTLFPPALRNFGVDPDKIIF